MFSTFCHRLSIQLWRFSMFWQNTFKVVCCRIVVWGKGLRNGYVILVIYNLFHFALIHSNGLSCWCVSIRLNLRNGYVILVSSNLFHSSAFDTGYVILVISNLFHFALIQVVLWIYMYSDPQWFWCYPRSVHQEIGRLYRQTSAFRATYRSIKGHWYKTYLANGF